MAFLVCYSETLGGDREEQAAYLPQSFYELIFRVCREDAVTYPVLHRIARLGYKSPAIRILGADLPGLVSELRALGDTDHGGRTFMASAEEAVRRSCGLTISGDMYPELG